MLLFYKRIFWLMFSIWLYNSLNHRVEMGLANVQSMRNETLETEKGSSCIYLRSKNRMTEANIRQRFRCRPPKYTDFDVVCLWFIFEYCESMRIGLRGTSETSKIGGRKSDGWLWKRIFDRMGVPPAVSRRKEGRFCRQVHYCRQWIHRMRDCRVCR